MTEIPWGHNVALFEKIKDPDERLWYAQKTIEHGWSRNVLVHQIESDLYRRQGSAISNFHATLPAPQSDLAHHLLKDPYTFDFLTLGEAVQERDLEQGPIEHIQKFLLELGMGFAFVGRRYGDDQPSNWSDHLQGEEPGDRRVFAARCGEADWVGGIPVDGSIAEGARPAVADSRPGASARASNGNPRSVIVRRGRDS